MDRARRMLYNTCSDKAGRTGQRATWAGPHALPGGTVYAERYFDLLAAVVERAQLDAHGTGISNIAPAQRQRFVLEAQQWLTWAAQELRTYGDSDTTHRHNRGRKL